MQYICFVEIKFFNWINIKGMSRMKDHVEYQRVLLKASQQMIKIIEFDTPCKKKKFAGWRTKHSCQKKMKYQAVEEKKWEKNVIKEAHTLTAAASIYSKNGLFSALVISFIKYTKST